MGEKICLLTITASHYRKRIYQLLDKELNCSFIMGKDGSSVKRMDTSILKNSIDIKNKKIGGSNWYFQSEIITKTKKYDILINDLGIYCISSWLLLVFSKFRKQKIYNWDHGWYGREGFVKKWIKRLYFKLADGSFIYGNYAKDLMIKNGFDANKLHVIHNSLDYDKQLELRNTILSTTVFHTYFGNKNPVLCFIGRLTKVKKLDLLIDAINLLRQKGELYNLILIGEGEMKPIIEKQVAELHLENQVWFYGACYDEKINAELIYNSDLCIAPGNIGLTAMHAMMFGCPCISHNNFPWQMPEFEAIREWKTGLFFEYDNVDALAKAISTWFLENIDKRQNVRNECFEEIDKNWNPHNQIEIIKKVIYG